MWIDTWADAERERGTLSWQFELRVWGISSGFPLTNYFDLPGSWSIFGISQDSPTCAHASLGQGNSTRKTHKEDIPWPHSSLTYKEPFCMCGQGGLLTSRMRNMWSGRGPASSLKCSAILLLEFQSTGNESPVTLL